MCNIYGILTIYRDSSTVCAGLRSLLSAKVRSGLWTGTILYHDFFDNALFWIVSENHGGEEELDRSSALYQRQDRDRERCPKGPQERQGYPEPEEALAEHIIRSVHWHGPDDDKYCTQYRGDDDGFDLSSPERSVLLWSQDLACLLLCQLLICQTFDVTVIYDLNFALSTGPVEIVSPKREGTDNAVDGAGYK